MAGIQLISDDNQPITITIAAVEAAEPPADHNTDAEAAGTADITSGLN